MNCACLFEKPSSDMLQRLPPQLALHLSDHSPSHISSARSFSRSSIDCALNHRELRGAPLAFPLQQAGGAALTSGMRVVEWLDLGLWRFRWWGPLQSADPTIETATNRLGVDLGADIDQLNVPVPVVPPTSGSTTRLGPEGVLPLDWVVQ
jgi:hypothetical protein